MSPEQGFNVLDKMGLYTLCAVPFCVHFEGLSHFGDFTGKSLAYNLFRLFCIRR